MPNDVTVPPTSAKIDAFKLHRGDVAIPMNKSRIIKNTYGLQIKRVLILNVFFALLLGLDNLSLTGGRNIAVNVPTIRKNVAKISMK